MTNQKKYNDWILSIGIALFALACIFFSNTASNALGMKNEYLTPNNYSNIISCVLLAALGAQLLMTLLTKEKQVQDEEKIEPIQRGMALNVAFIIICAVIFVLGMRYIGFYISTAVCLFIMNMTFENWNKAHIIKSIAFSLGVCAIFFVVFRYLKVFLPNAMLF